MSSNSNVVLLLLLCGGWCSCSSFLRSSDVLVLLFLEGIRHDKLLQFLFQLFIFLVPPFVELSLGGNIPSNYGSRTRVSANNRVDILCVFDGILKIIHVIQERGVLFN